MTITKHQAISRLLGKTNWQPRINQTTASADSNIALVKYWGKRCQTLNLPVTSSLSVTLKDKGCITQLQVIDKKYDVIELNGQRVDAESSFAKRVVAFLNCFREPNHWHVHMKTESTIPVAAGLASSACGYAALSLALNELLGWRLSRTGLSQIARLGSGSASRSFWPGFVEWHAGTQQDGSDSFAEPLDQTWPGLCLGLPLITANAKPISSREAMQRTIDTAPLYQAWPTQVKQDIKKIKQAITTKDFQLLGETAEQNAMAMHATMLASRPSVCYYWPETIAMMQQIWKLRADGIPVYFTQDAGPNLKLIFEKESFSYLRSSFERMEIVEIF